MGQNSQGKDYSKFPFISLLPKELDFIMTSNVLDNVLSKVLLQYKRSILPAQKAYPTLDRACREMGIENALRQHPHI